MNFKRLRILFLYAAGMWTIAPFVLNFDVHNYIRYASLGFIVSISGAFAFYLLDVLTNKLLKKLK